jgi:hypothetical protein
MSHEAAPRTDASWDPPQAQYPTFESLSDEEAAEIRAGAAKPRLGTCVVLGYACSSSGGFHWGVCAIFGVTT